MEVIVIEHEAFRRIEEMFTESQKIIRDQANKLANTKITWVNVKDAAEITGYNEKTLKLRKTEIGYRSHGGMVFFKLSDLENWMEKYYRSPRIKGRSH